MGAADSFDADWDGSLARKLRGCAEEISARLGKTRG